MNDRIRYGAYGGALVVVFVLASHLVSYGVGPALMLSFLASLFGAMLIVVTSYDRPGGSPVDGGAQVATASAPVESSLSVPYAETLFPVAVGACVTSLVGVVLFMTLG